MNSQGAAKELLKLAEALLADERTAKLPKRKKDSLKAEMAEVIRKITGLSLSVSGKIADAVVRKRDLDRLALQQDWPVEDGQLTGDKGSIALDLLPSLYQSHVVLSSKR